MGKGEFEARPVETKPSVVYKRKEALRTPLF